VGNIVEELGFTDPASQAMDGLAADSSSSSSISCDQTPAKNGNDMEDPIIIGGDRNTGETAGKAASNHGRYQEFGGASWHNRGTVLGGD
jgi:hypothetical protein